MNGEALLSGKLNGERLNWRPAATGRPTTPLRWTRWSARRRRPPTAIRNVDIDMGGMSQLDTYGAWLLERLLRGASEQRRTGARARLPDQFRTLVETVHRTTEVTAPARDSGAT